jgi:hypothetical protein
VASKKKRDAHEDEGDERTEAKVFFRTVHEIKASTAKDGASLASTALNRAEGDLRPFFYEPADQAKEIEKVERKRPPEKHEVVTKDEKHALGLLKAFTKMSGVNVHVHDAYRA